MTKLILLIELNYDAETMHGNDEEAREWFFSILTNDRLILHSNEIGDEIGEVTVLEVKVDKNDSHT